MLPPVCHRSLTMHGVTGCRSSQPDQCSGMCVAHLLGNTYVNKSTGADGWKATLGERDTRSKHARNCMGVCKFVPLSRVTYGSVWPGSHEGPRRGCANG